MQFVQFRGHTDIRRFVPLWGALTIVYVTAVLYRALAVHQAPGLPSFAGFTAVLAVWLEGRALVRPRLRLHISVIVTLVTSITLNIAAIARAATRDRIASITEGLFTLLLLIVLVSKTHEMVAGRSSSKDAE